MRRRKAPERLLTGRRRACRGYMEIVFFILKTAGVVLLVILILLLLLAALLLFVPVRYRAEGSLPEGGRPRASVRVTWLLHLLSFRLEYADGVKITVRAAGISIQPERWRRQEKEEIPPVPKKDSGAPENGSGALKKDFDASENGRDVPENGLNAPETAVGAPAPEQAASGQMTAEKTEKPDKTGKNVPGKTEHPERAAAEEADCAEGNAAEETGSAESSAAEELQSPESAAAPEEEESETAAPPRSGLAERLRKWAAALKQRIAGLAEGLQDAGQALERILKKLERIRGTVNYYRELLEDERSQETVRMIWKQLKGLLSETKPKKLSLELTVGSADPAVTGNVLAVHGMFYPWIGEAVHIIPDFERDRLGGEFYAEGRIRTCVVLVMAWLMVGIRKKQQEVRQIPKIELIFICCSGIATGASWLCYYRALQEGPASIVAPVDKLSVLVTVVFSYFVFGEKLSRKAAAGLVLLTAGTIAMAAL